MRLTEEDITRLNEINKELRTINRAAKTNGGDFAFATLETRLNLIFKGLNLIFKKINDDEYDKLRFCQYFAKNGYSQSNKIKWAIFKLYKGYRDIDFDNYDEAYKKYRYLVNKVKKLYSEKQAQKSKIKTL